MSHLDDKGSKSFRHNPENERIVKSGNWGEHADVFSSIKQIANLLAGTENPQGE
jgi:hypothetical protein